MSKQRLNINYYEVFGIPPTASSEDISAAHKALAKKYHPDINESKDAHERMTMLNKANEVLSDTVKRREYDNKLKRDEQQRQHKEFVSSQIVKAKWSGVPKVTDERIEKAEVKRRKAEARLRADEAARIQAQARIKEREQQKSKESIHRSKQIRADINRQQVINELSGTVMDGSAKRKKRMTVDEELHNATKVLLSLVRNDDKHLRQLAEEKDRKQRIEEILSLVKEYKEEANPDRLI